MYNKPKLNKRFIEYFAIIVCYFGIMINLQKT